MTEIGPKERNVAFAGLLTPTEDPSAGFGNSKDSPITMGDGSSEEQEGRNDDDGFWRLFSWIHIRPR